MTKLYAVWASDDWDNTLLARCLRLLPKERREKTLRYRQNRDQKTSAAAYLLLMYALHETFGLLDPQVETDAHGKPYLKDAPHIHFNISHCPLGCACAVSDRPVGVDIQDIRPFSWRLAQRCCTESELVLLQRADDPALAFTRMWAMKESYAKMTGEGLSCGLQHVDTVRLEKQFTVFEKNGCCIAAAEQQDF